MNSFPERTKKIGLEGYVDVNQKMANDYAANRKYGSNKNLSKHLGYTVEDYHSNYNRLKTKKKIKKTKMLCYFKD